MTEQEFQTQMWRPYDKITTAEGVPGKVLGVNFSTKSVRAYISGAPEWVKCGLIETHTTGKGGYADDASIIEELHNKVLSQQDEIDRLRNERAVLKEKMTKNYLKDVLAALNTMQKGLQEKKQKMALIEDGLRTIAAIVERVNEEGNNES